MAVASQPCTGEIYHWIGQMRGAIDQLQLSSSLSECSARREEALHVIDERWEFLHNPLYSLAYALNPRYVGLDVLSIPEVRKHVEDELKRLSHDNEQFGGMLLELQEFQSTQGRAW